MTDEVVRVRGLGHAYGRLTVLHDIHVDVRAGEVVAIIGANGAGKSTLLRLLLSFLPITSGEVSLAGQDVRALGRRAIARIAAFVPQGFQSDVELTVRDMVAMGRTPHLGRFQSERTEDREAVARALDAVDLGGLASRFFNALSGGERQRVLLARAFAQDTPVLVLDEPNANLDFLHAYEILDLVRTRVQSRKGAAAIAALHDLNLAARFCDRIVMLHEHRVVADGSPKEVLTRERIAQVFGVLAQVRDGAHGTPLIEILGPARD